MTRSAAVNSTGRFRETPLTRTSGSWLSWIRVQHPVPVNPRSERTNDEHVTDLSTVGRLCRPRVGSLGYASWPTNAATGCTGQMSVMAVNHGDTTGTTESKRLTPGHLMGALT